MAPPVRVPARPASPAAFASSRSTLTVPAPPPARRGPVLDHAVPAVAPAPGGPAERTSTPMRPGCAHWTPSTGPGPDVAGATAVIRRTVHAVARARLRIVVTVGASRTARSPASTCCRGAPCRRRRRRWPAPRRGRRACPPAGRRKQPRRPARAAVGAPGQGEKRRRNEGRKPTVTAPAGDTETAMPPLSATPGGVCNVHDGAGGGLEEQLPEGVLQVAEVPHRERDPGHGGCGDARGEREAGPRGRAGLGAAVTPAARATAATPVSAPHTEAERPRCLTNS